MRRMKLSSLLMVEVELREIQHRLSGHSGHSEVARDVRSELRVSAAILAQSEERSTIHETLPWNRGPLVTLPAPMPHIQDIQPK